MRKPKRFQPVFDFGATRTMAKPFLHLLCLTYGALSGLFATRFVLDRIPLPRRTNRPRAAWRRRVSRGASHP